MGCQRAVLRRDRPLVVVKVDLGPARGDHRLDRKRHAGLQERPPTGLAEVRDLRLLVVRAADAVADERADDRETRALDDLLDGVRDVTDPVAGPRLLDAGSKGFLSHLEQAGGLGIDLADAESERAVRDEPGKRDADVDRDEVALLDPVAARDAVDDHRVRRDARPPRKAAVALRRRDAAVLADELLRDAVELIGRDARLNLLAEERD